jgi:GntR family transcriptional regulator, transcriptional repressor for pyruvate dehydrogenase complex
MEPMGLVSRLEQELERMISSGMLPAEGRLPSEQTLARRHGVSRATLREALRRLAARGLVVQHPGRRTRAVALEQAVSLENLGVVLHGEGGVHPGRRRLLEGYFALKREVTVELLSASCALASERERGLLQQACFALCEAARWEAEGGRWVAREFELLRLAARVADRPEYFLLVQSLERAFQGMAGRILRHLDAEALQQWTRCALHGLGEKDPQALQRALRPLLQACDERLLGHLAPALEAEAEAEADDTPEPPRLVAEALPVGNSHTESARLPGEAVPNRSACLTGSSNEPPQEAPLPAPPAAGCCCPPGLSVLEVDGPESHADAREEETRCTSSGASPPDERGAGDETGHAEGEDVAPFVQHATRAFTFSGRPQEERMTESLPRESRWEACPP